MKFFLKLFNKNYSQNNLGFKNEKHTKKGDMSTNTTNNNITNNNTTNHYHISESTNFSDELNNEIKEKNTRKTEIENLSFDNEDEKIKNIKSIEHMQDIWELEQFSLMSSKDIYQTIKNNNLIEKIIDVQDARERKKIKDNLKFLEESNHEEKTAIVWMFICRVMINEQNYKIFQTHANNIRTKYNLKKHYLEIDSLALFNKFGIFEQSTLENIAFSNQSKYNFEDLFKTSLENIYNIFPEIKLIYSKTAININSKTEIVSLIPWISLLSYSCKWLMMDLGMTFKD